MDSAANVFIFSSVIISLARLGILADVRSPPYFIKQLPKTAEILLREEILPLIMVCEAKGHPQPDYFWTRNDQRYNWTSENDRISQISGKGSLLIRNLKLSDSGRYQCFAENKWGIASSNSMELSIRKQYFEPVRKEIIVKHALEGLPYNLSCEAPDGYPKPSFDWFILHSSDSYTSIIKLNDSRLSVDPTGTLWFSNITLNDSIEDSYYICLATQSWKHTKTGNRIKLIVVQTYSSSEQNKIPPVKQYASEKIRMVISNTTVTLYCIFAGTPQPTITWRKNGKELQLQNTISLKNNGKLLEIKNITSENEGNYTCQASNGVGEPISHTIDLKVLIEPYFTKKPESTTIAEDETVQYHCEAAGNPTPTITWIHNGKPLSEASPNPRRKISSKSIVIERVKLSDTGNYGCNATNSLSYIYQDVYLNVLSSQSRTN